MDVWKASPFILVSPSISLEVPNDARGHVDLLCDSPITGKLYWNAGFNSVGVVCDLYDATIRGITQRLLANRLSENESRSPILMFHARYNADCLDDRPASLPDISSDVRVFTTPRRSRVSLRYAKSQPLGIRQADIKLHHVLALFTPPSDLDEKGATMTTVQHVLSQLEEPFDLQQFIQLLNEEDWTDEGETFMALRQTVLTMLVAAEDEDALSDAFQNGENVLIDLSDLILSCTGMDEALVAIVLEQFLSYQSGNSTIVFDSCQEYLRSGSTLAGTIETCLRSRLATPVSMLFTTSDPSALPAPILQRQDFVISGRIPSAQWKRLLMDNFLKEGGDVLDALSQGEIAILSPNSREIHQDGKSCYWAGQAVSMQFFPTSRMPRQQAPVTTEEDDSFEMDGRMAVEVEVEVEEETAAETEDSVYFSAGNTDSLEEQESDEEYATPHDEAYTGVATPEEMSEYETPIETPPSSSESSSPSKSPSPAEPPSPSEIAHPTTLIADPPLQIMQEVMVTPDMYFLPLRSLVAAMLVVTGGRCGVRALFDAVGCQFASQRDGELEKIRFDFHKFVHAAEREGILEITHNKQEVEWLTLKPPLLQGWRGEYTHIPVSQDVSPIKEIVPSPRSPSLQHRSGELSLRYSGIQKAVLTEPATPSYATLPLVNEPGYPLIQESLEDVMTFIEQDVSVCPIPILPLRRSDEASARTSLVQEVVEIGQPTSSDRTHPLLKLFYEVSENDLMIQETASVEEVISPRTPPLLKGFDVVLAQDSAVSDWEPIAQAPFFSYAPDILGALDDGYDQGPLTHAILSPKKETLFIQKPLLLNGLDDVSTPDFVAQETFLIENPTFHDRVLSPYGDLDQTSEPNSGNGEVLVDSAALSRRTSPLVEGLGVSSSHFSSVEEIESIKQLASPYTNPSLVGLNDSSASGSVIGELTSSDRTGPFRHGSLLLEEVDMGPRQDSQIKETLLVQADTSPRASGPLAASGNLPFDKAVTCDHFPKRYKNLVEAMLKGSGGRCRTPVRLGDVVSLYGGLNSLKAIGWKSLSTILESATEDAIITRSMEGHICWLALNDPKNWRQTIGRGPIFKGATVSVVEIQEAQWEIDSDLLSRDVKLKVYVPLYTVLVALHRQRSMCTFTVKEVDAELKDHFPTAVKDSGNKTIDDYLAAAQEYGIGTLKFSDGVWSVMLQMPSMRSTRPFE